MQAAPRFLRWLAAASAGAFCTALLASPAAWYTWSSKRDGTQVCAQVSPGEGWVRTAGPYKDARCENTGRPGY